jgi:diphthamide synthase subunit DPH2
MLQVTDGARFEGYTDAEALAKKLVKDLVISGDTYFNSGDLMKTIDVSFSFGKNTINQSTEQATSFAEKVKMSLPTK